jgi:2-oxoglutarate ferredoxin oxidoreductase subunit alpha
VIAPGNVQELYELTYEAFDLADHYRNPVIILSDAVLGQMMEPVMIDTLPEKRPAEKEWAVKGQGANPRKVIKIAPHTDEELIEWNRRLKKKYLRIQEKEQRYEAMYTEGASTLVVAFGSTARIALDAIAKTREEGVPVGLFRPVFLWPFPEKGLKAQLHRGVDKILVVEANNGQMIADVRLAVGNDIEVIHYGTGGGHIFTPHEIHREIMRFTRQ